MGRGEDNGHARESDVLRESIKLPPIPANVIIDRVEYFPAADITVIYGHRPKK